MLPQEQVRRNTCGGCPSCNRASAPDACRALSQSLTWEPQEHFTGREEGAEHEQLSRTLAFLLCCARGPWAQSSNLQRASTFIVPLVGVPRPWLDRQNPECTCQVNTICKFLSHLARWAPSCYLLPT